MKKNFSRWGVLALLVVPMFASYFFDDMFSAVSQIFKNPEMLELGWDSADYGFYAGGYSFLCVWGGLIFCGMLLDKWGVRITGSIFVGMMATGAAMVTAAISAGLAPKVSLTIAYIGCMLFGSRGDAFHSEMVQGRPDGARDGASAGDCSSGNGRRTADFPHAHC